MIIILWQSAMFTMALKSSITVSSCVSYQNPPFLHHTSGFTMTDFDGADCGETTVTNATVFVKIVKKRVTFHPDCDEIEQLQMSRELQMYKKKKEIIIFLEDQNKLLMSDELELLNELNTAASPTTAADDGSASFSTASFSTAQDQFSGQSRKDSDDEWDDDDDGSLLIEELKQLLITEENDGEKEKLDSKKKDMITNIGMEQIQDFIMQLLISHEYEKATKLINFTIIVFQDIITENYFILCIKHRIVDDYPDELSTIKDSMKDKFPIFQNLFI
jgi:hypothetical protein